MSAEEDLEQLKLQRKKQEEIDANLELKKAIWSLWKYLAYNKDWFDEFVQNNKIPSAEIRSIKEVKDSIPKGDFVSPEHGAALWQEILDLEEKDKEVTKNIDVLLVSLREQKVSFREIAPYYGTILSGVHNYMKRKGLKE